MRRRVTMALPGETEAGSAGKQPCRGIAWWAHRDDDRGRGRRLPRSSQNHIGSVDPNALKIPARRAEYSLTESAPSPFQAEPAHFDILITNHSSEPVGRLHIVYPHPIFPKGSEKGGKTSFSDLTETWLHSDSEYNMFYGTPETPLERKRVNGSTAITLKLIDPNDILRMLDYTGFIRGAQDLKVYQPELAGRSIGRSGSSWQAWGGQF